MAAGVLRVLVAFAGGFRGSACYFAIA